MRPLVVILLSVCFGLAGSAVHPSHLYSQATAQTDFATTAAAAAAHGKRAEAEQLATSRGSSDSAAAVVLAQLLIERGNYREAQDLLQPHVARDQTGDAALELALLYRMTGRAAEAEPLLNGVFKRGASSTDSAVLFRAGRAAHALNRARDANTFYRAAERAGGNPAVIETAWGRLFLEKDNKPEALKSFQAALQSDASWAPAHVGLAARPAGRRSAGGGRCGRARPRDRSAARGSPSAPGVVSSRRRSR